MRLGINIGANIEQNGCSSGSGGKHGSQRRPVHAGQRAQHHFGRGHGRARVASGDESGSAAIAHLPQAYAHRGIFFRAHRLRRLLVHFDNFGGVHHLDGKALRGRVVLQFGAHLLLAPYQQHFNFVMSRGQNGAFDFGLRGPVRTHGVEGYGGWHWESTECLVPSTGFCPKLSYLTKRF